MLALPTKHTGSAQWRQLVQYWMSGGSFQHPVQVIWAFAGSFQHPVRVIYSDDITCDMRSFQNEHNIWIRPSSLYCPTPGLDPSLTPTNLRPRPARPTSTATENSSDETTSEENIIVIVSKL